MREEGEDFAATEKARAGNSPRRVRHLCITVAGQQVVHQHPGAEEPAAALAPTKGRHDERQGCDQVGRNSQQNGSLPAGCAHSRNIEVLKVAYPSVHDLEAMRRGSGAKVVALDERRAEATDACFARHGCAGRAATDHEDVEFTASQIRKVPPHCRNDTGYPGRRGHECLVQNSATRGSASKQSGEFCIALVLCIILSRRAHDTPSARPPAMTAGCSHLMTKRIPQSRVFEAQVHCLGETLHDSLRTECAPLGQHFRSTRRRVTSVAHCSAANNPGSLSR